MISIDTDSSKQLLIIRLEQTVTMDEAKAAVERFRRCVEDLKPGFLTFTDLSDLDCMEDECAPYIIQVMDLCAEKGVSRIYRVMPDPRKDIGFTIMSRFHYNRAVQIVSFESRKEAEEALAELN